MLPLGFELSLYDDRKEKSERLEGKREWDQGLNERAVGRRLSSPNKPQVLRVWIGSRVSAPLGETDWLSAGSESARIRKRALGCREQAGWWHWAAGHGEVLVLSRDDEPRMTGQLS